MRKAEVPFRSAKWYLSPRVRSVGGGSSMEQRDYRLDLKKLSHIVKYWRHLDPPLIKLLRGARAEHLRLRDYDRPPMNGSKNRVAILDRLHAAVHFQSVVETGTWLGTTTEYFATLGGSPQVYSTEISDVYFKFASMRHRLRPNIRLANLSSPELLRQIDGTLASPTLVYLDAHWHKYLPLRDELAICTRWPDTVIMIDDFKVEGDPSFPFDDYGPVTGQLTLDYIRDQIEGFEVFFPNFTRPLDGDAGTGFVILAKSPTLINALASEPLLRRQSV